jgi:hypothetical protein
MLAEMDIYIFGLLCVFCEGSSHFGSYLMAHVATATPSRADSLAQTPKFSFTQLSPSLRELRRLGSSTLTPSASTVCTDEQLSQSTDQLDVGGQHVSSGSESGTNAPYIRGRSGKLLQRSRTSDQKGWVICRVQTMIRLGIGKK